MFLNVVIENIQKVWNIISPYLAGITIGGIVSSCFYALFSGSIKKFINKIQIEKIVKDTVDSTTEQIKGIAISIELQPLVQDELSKIVKVIDERTEKQLQLVEEKTNRLIDCFDKFTAYFDNSIAVPQEVKDDLHKALAEAKGLEKPDTTQVIDVKPLIEKKKSKNIIDTSNQTTNVR